MKTLLLLLSLLLLSACASTPQTKALLDDSSDLPKSHQISNFPFVEQTENYCGPASLAMVARFAGRNPSLQDLGAMMFTPEKKGSFQSDFIGAARRLGLMTVQVSGLRSILREVGDNHPVVVLENLGSSQNPLWHYAVLHGYDLSQKEAVFHSGKDANLILDLAAFERLWSGADYWAVVVLKAGALPSTSTALENLNAASSLERVGKNQEANLAYRSISEKFPDSVGAYFGLGNTFAALGNYRKSALAFEKASVLLPQSAAVWNNLTEVYLKLGEKKRASRAALKAKSPIAK